MPRLTHDQIRSVTNGKSKNERQCPECGHWHLVLFGEDEFDCKNGCDEKALNQKLRQMLGTPGYKPPKAEPPKQEGDGEARLSGPLTLAEYANAKSLPLDYLRDVWALHDTVYKGTPCVAFTYGNGMVKYRGTGQKDKLNHPGSTVDLYGWERVVEKSTASGGGIYLHIVEGESDVQTMDYLNFCAIGVPGQGVWKPEWAQRIRKLKPGLVLVHQEPDDCKLPRDKWTWAKAEAWLRRISAELQGLRVRGASLQAKDASEEWLNIQWMQEEAKKQFSSVIIQNYGPATVQECVSVEEISDLPVEALSGRLGEWCQENLSMFPRAYAWLALVTVAGSLIPLESETERNEGEDDAYGVQSEIETTPRNFERTNLYTCLVGPKGSGKSTCWEHAMALFGLTQNDDPILNLKAGSMEGLARKLQGRKCLYVNELGHLLEKSKIDGASFPTVLNDLYYSDHQELITAKNRVEIHSRLSIAGGVVTEKFDDLFGANTTGGFYDRFTFGICPTPFEYLWTPYQGKVYRPRDLQPQRISMSQQVLDARTEQVRLHPEWNKRVIEHALRVAGICAAFDGKTELDDKALQATWVLAEYENKCRSGLEPNPGKNQSAAAQNRLVNWMRKHAGNGEIVKVSTLGDSSGVRQDYGTGIFKAVLKDLHLDDTFTVNWKERPWTVKLNPATGR